MKKSTKRFVEFVLLVMMVFAVTASALAQTTSTPTPYSKLPAITTATPAAQTQVSKPEKPAITSSTGPVSAKSTDKVTTKSSTVKRSVKSKPIVIYKQSVPAMTRAQADELIRLNKQQLAESQNTNATLGRLEPAVNGLDSYTREHFPAVTNSLTAISQQTAISYTYIWWVANGLAFAAAILVLVLIVALVSWVWHAIGARFNQPVVEHHVV